jgi:hypothetical protein
MLFFAISGAWQAFRLHEDRKDGSYKAPVLLEQLSDLHKAERLSGTSGRLFKVGQLLLASAFVLTAMLGVLMALRVARPVWPVWLTLAAGVLLPVLLALAVAGGGHR